MKFPVAVTMLLIVVPFCLTMAAIVQGKEPAAAPASKAELKTLKDKASYMIGRSVARDLMRQGLDLESIDLEKFVSGFGDELNKVEKPLSNEEMQKVMEEFGKEQTEKQVSKLKAVAETNKKEGDAFLAANTKKQGVVTTKSGLQYQILKEGKGAKPKKTDTVTTHYAGTLIDGTEFDSSHKRGEPATFPVGGVIAGWTEALQLMPVGSKWRLFVPSQLGYGAQGAGPDIGPNATLVFEVELLGIGEPEATEPGAEAVPER